MSNPFPFQIRALMSSNHYFFLHKKPSWATDAQPKVLMVKANLNLTIKLFVQLKLASHRYGL